MSLLTIILFFLYTWGFGYTLSFFLKNSDNVLERNFMRISIGLGTIPILGVILNLLHIPLDWRVFLMLSLVTPIIVLGRKVKQKQLFKESPVTLSKTNLFILCALLIFAFSLYMYTKGSFSYPWLEDGDPWEYATATQFIAEEKTYSKPSELWQKTQEKGEYYYYGLSHYAEPYPIGYTMVMGLLKQTSPSMIWTLKFFNALIISLSMLFFFFLVRQLTKNNTIALASTIILLAIPSYLTHFIFSQALAVTLIPVALYAYERMKTHTKWWIPAAIITSSILITQMVAAMVFPIFFLGSYFLVSLFTNRKQAWMIAIAGICACLLAFLYWGPMLATYGLEGIKGQNAIGTDNPLKPGSTVNTNIMLVAMPTYIERIDSSFGLGIGVFALLIISIALIAFFWKQINKKKEDGTPNDWTIIVIAWLLTLFYNIQSSAFPIGFTPHRTWPYFAFAVSMVSGFAIYLLLKIGKSKLMKAVVLIAIFLLLFVVAFPDRNLFGSFTSKWKLNTVMWPQHKFIQDPNGDLGGYIWLTSFPESTRITSICRRDDEVISYDKSSDAQWDLEQIEFKRSFINKTPEEIRSFYQQKSYDYIIIDSKCVEAFGINETNKKLMELRNASFNARQPAQFTNFLLLEI